MRDILLVEDEENIQFANKTLLERRGGYKVRLAMNLEEARRSITEAEPDLVVLDIILPDGSGLDFLRELRQDKNIPVLLLTALSETSDELKGLQAGGDDYITKPYDIHVLLARIEMVLQRTTRLPETITKGILTLHITSNEAFVNGGNLSLSQKEFSLLTVFVQNENRIIRAEHLYEQVWGRKLEGDDNAVKMAVSRLRKKLAHSGFTVTAERGAGYCFERG